MHRTVIRYNVKKFFEIPGFVLTKPSWDWDWVDYSQPWESLVSDITAGDGSPLKLFLQCNEFYAYTNSERGIFTRMKIIQCEAKIQHVQSLWLFFKCAR